MTQVLEELKVLDGQVATHEPEDASLLLAQVKQKVADPEQVEQEGSQLLHVLRVGSRNVPEGQESTHFP